MADGRWQCATVIMVTLPALALCAVTVTGHDPQS